MAANNIKEGWNTIDGQEIYAVKIDDEMYFVRGMKNSPAGKVSAHLYRVTETNEYARVTSVKTADFLRGGYVLQ